MVEIVRAEVIVYTRVRNYKRMDWVVVSNLLVVIDRSVFVYS